MFAYDDAITERYPTIRAGVIHATGLSNGPSPPELPDEYRAEQRAASERLEATAIADLPQVAAWRRVFSEFGAKSTRCRNTAEALLRRLSQRGDIPTVNALVDIGNLVSLRHARRRFRPGQHHRYHHPSRAAHETRLDVGDVGSDRYHHALGYLLEQATLLGDEYTAFDVGDQHPPRLRALLLHSAGAEAARGVKGTKRNVE